MLFKAEKIGSGNFETVILNDMVSGCEVEIYSFGAQLNAFSLGTSNEKNNVIDGFSSPQEAMENITDGFKSAKLSPFVCRLAGGKYSFENNTYRVQKFNIGESAIHGLLYDAVFTIIEIGADDECAFATLDYHYTKQNEGFPFSYHTEISYLLQKNNSLSITTKITNTGNANMPLSDGWHPYFKICSTVDKMLFNINTKEMAVFDNNLLPTGESVPYSMFNIPEKFGDTFFDNCFKVSGNGEPVCVLEDPQTGLKLEIIPGSSYHYLQIYTPPHRKSIAIENLSSVPDAFNNGIGLIIAEPGGQYVFETTYRLS